MVGLFHRAPKKPPTWRGLVTVIGERPSGRLDEGPARCQQRQDTGAGRIKPIRVSSRRDAPRYSAQAASESPGTIHYAARRAK